MPDVVSARGASASTPGITLPWTTQGVPVAQLSIVTQLPRIAQVLRQILPASALSLVGPTALLVTAYVAYGFAHSGNKDRVSREFNAAKSNFIEVLTKTYGGDVARQIRPLLQQLDNSLAGSIDQTKGQIGTAIAIATALGTKITDVVKKRIFKDGETNGRVPTNRFPPTGSGPSCGISSSTLVVDHHWSPKRTVYGETTGWYKDANGNVVPSVLVTTHTSIRSDTRSAQTQNSAFGQSQAVGVLHSVPVGTNVEVDSAATCRVGDREIEAPKPEPIRIIVR